MDRLEWGGGALYHESCSVACKCAHMAEIAPPVRLYLRCKHAHDGPLWYSQTRVRTEYPVSIEWGVAPQNTNEPKKTPQQHKKKTFVCLLASISLRT